MIGAIKRLGALLEYAVIHGGEAEATRSRAVLTRLVESEISFDTQVEGYDILHFVDARKRKRSENQMVFLKSYRSFRHSISAISKVCFAK